MKGRKTSRSITKDRMKTVESNESSSNHDVSCSMEREHATRERKRERMMNWLLNVLLSPLPRFDFDHSESSEYDKMIRSSNEREFSYGSTYPKYRFLAYLSLKEEVVFHGSNHTTIDLFEPREQTLINGKMTKAVFATEDPTWSIFYAIFDRSKLVGSFRNGCVVYKDKKHHFYSLNESTMRRRPWTDGMVYIFPKAKFKRVDNKNIYFDEWISHEPVMPIGRLKVGIEDFYFKDKIATHPDHESLLKSWLFYKYRVKRYEKKTV